MSVLINESCINCGACIDECPVDAIANNEDNPINLDIFYVYPDKCVECVGFHADPACADSCPTDDCITWDMPFTEEYKDFFKDNNYIEGLNYHITENKNILPYKKEITISERKKENL